MNLLRTAGYLLAASLAAAPPMWEVPSERVVINPAKTHVLQAPRHLRVGHRSKRSHQLA